MHEVCSKVLEHHAHPFNLAAKFLGLVDFRSASCGGKREQQPCNADCLRAVLPEAEPNAGSKQTVLGNRGGQKASGCRNGAPCVYPACLAPLFTKPPLPRKPLPLALAGVGI